MSSSAIGNGSLMWHVNAHGYNSFVAFKWLYKSERQLWSFDKISLLILISQMGSRNVLNFNLPYRLSNSERLLIIYSSWALPQKLLHGHLIWQLVLNRHCKHISTCKQISVWCHHTYLAIVKANHKIIPTIFHWL